MKASFWVLLEVIVVGVLLVQSMVTLLFLINRPFADDANMRIFGCCSFRSGFSTAN